MHTSALILRQVRRAVAAAFLLGGFPALLQLALPLCALHVIDSAIPARSVETLALLCALAAGALATLACVNAARARILLRAGLWLDHTLGCHTLEQGLAQNAKPDAMADSAASLARLRTAFANGTVLPVLDLPWLLALAAGFALLDWRLAAAAGGAAVVLVARILIALRPLGSQAAKVEAAARRADTWWHSVARMTGLSRLPATAAEQWERLNREHVAGAYILASRSAGLDNFARLARTLAQVAVLALGGWLVIMGHATVGLLVASVLLQWRLLEPIERVVASLGDLLAARDAWRHVATTPAGVYADPRHASFAVPRLRISGPFAAGFAAVALFLSLGVGAAAFTNIGQLVTIAGAPIFETRLLDVFPKRAGLGGQILVAEGAQVAKGDVLATLDTKALDARIASLKLQAETARIEMRALNNEVVALVTPGAPALRNRAPLEKLETRITDLGRQSRDLVVKIAATEEELAQSRILAPASGRIVSISARPGMPVVTEAPLATIVTADTTLLGRLLAPFAASPRPPSFAPHLALAQLQAPR